MNLYKLRHYAMFLFQALNEHLPGMQEAIQQGRTAFVRDMNQIDQAEGVKLIMKAADRNYYMTINGFSLGMYLNMVREDQDSKRIGALQSQITDDRYDSLFDDIWKVKILHHLVNLVQYIYT